MKPPVFEYVVPESLDVALAAIAEHGGDAKPLAGGQSLVPAMNFRVAQPAVLVDLNPLLELDYVRQDDDGLRIGAMTRQRRVERDALVAERAPLLHETMPYIAHPQIRNRGTIGGSLAHADPAAELPVVAVALDARIKARSASGERWIPAAEFFQGIFTTALNPDELLVEVAFPAMPPRAGWAFVEFARRHGDYALMGVATVVAVDEQGVCRQARLVYLNAGDGPVAAKQAVQLLLGHPPSPDSIAAAANMAVDREITPFGNVHATADYQRHLARVLTRRALKQAFERAGGSISLVVR
ncbi:MAG TPA: xanthine dehydrogenase family protein subunit M [Anaerolineae bacterium]|nr:xanthine dehydrogenase family protein subunit M [Anaerolineae bacterium]